MQPFAKFKKFLWSGFTATLNFRKFKVALKPLRRNFLNFAKSCILDQIGLFDNTFSYGRSQSNFKFPKERKNFVNKKENATKKAHQRMERLPAKVASWRKPELMILHLYHTFHCSFSCIFMHCKFI